MFKKQFHTVSVQQSNTVKFLPGFRIFPAMDWVYSAIYEITPAEWASNQIIERSVALTIVMSLLQRLAQTTRLVNIVVSKLQRWVKQTDSISQYCESWPPERKLPAQM